MKKEKYFVAVMALVCALTGLYGVFLSAWLITKVVGTIGVFAAGFASAKLIEK